MAIIKKNTSNKYWWGCGENRTLYNCGWECELVQLPWKTVWRFSENGMEVFQKQLKIEQPYDPAIPGYIFEKKKWKHSHEKLRAPQCSQQHYLQPPRYGSKGSVHQQTNVLRRCDTQTHTHTGTLHSHKVEWKFAIHNNTDELEWYYAKWKKSKTDTVWYYLYVESKKWNWWI